jgi:hypothetical protein
MGYGPYRIATHFGTQTPTSGWNQAPSTGRYNSQLIPASGWEYVPLKKLVLLYHNTRRSCTLTIVQHAYDATHRWDGLG